MVYHPQYNQVEYNTHAYNFNTNWFSKLLLETVTATDGLITKLLTKLLSDSLTPSDSTAVKDMSKTLQETQFMVDIVTKSISEKLLTETLQIQHWLTTKKNQDKSDFTN